MVSQLPDGIDNLEDRPVESMRLRGSAHARRRRSQHSPYRWRRSQPAALDL